jgi:hypothetical protein
VGLAPRGRRLRAATADRSLPRPAPQFNVIDKLEALGINKGARAHRSSRPSPASPHPRADTNRRSPPPRRPAPAPRRRHQEGARRGLQHLRGAPPAAEQGPRRDQGPLGREDRQGARGWWLWRGLVSGLDSPRAQPNRRPTAPPARARADARGGPPALPALRRLHDRTAGRGAAPPPGLPHLDRLRRARRRPRRRPRDEADHRVLRRVAHRQDAARVHDGRHLPDKHQDARQGLLRHRGRLPPSPTPSLTRPAPPRPPLPRSASSTPRAASTPSACDRSPSATASTPTRCSTTSSTRACVPLPAAPPRAARLPLAALLCACLPVWRPSDILECHSPPARPPHRRRTTSSTRWRSLSRSRPRWPRSSSCVQLLP